MHEAHVARLFGMPAVIVPRAADPGGMIGRAALSGWMTDHVTARPEQPDHPSRPSSSWASVRRLVATALVVSAGTAVVVFGGIALVPLLVSQLVSLINLATWSFVWLVQAFEEGRGVWDVIVLAGRAIGSALTAPRVIGGIVALEVLGLAALYGLDRLLSVDRKDKRP